MPDIEFAIVSFAIGVILFELINYFKFRLWNETLSTDNLDYFRLFGGLFFLVGRICVADGGEI